MVTAPINSNATPVAASGTSTGAMSSAAGRIRPAAARSSRVAMALRARGLKSLTHCAAGPPTAAIFSRGTNALEVLISRTHSGGDPQCDVHAFSCLVVDLGEPVDGVVGVDSAADDRRYQQQSRSENQGKTRAGPAEVPRSRRVPHERKSSGPLLLRATSSTRTRALLEWRY